MLQTTWFLQYLAFLPWQLVTLFLSWAQSQFCNYSLFYTQNSGAADWDDPPKLKLVVLIYYSPATENPFHLLVDCWLYSKGRNSRNPMIICALWKRAHWEEEWMFFPLVTLHRHEQMAHSSNIYQAVNTGQLTCSAQQAQGQAGHHDGVPVLSKLIYVLA